MYFNPNTKWNYFTYKKETYLSGTNLIYNGECFLNEKVIMLNNVPVTWLYSQNGRDYFTSNGLIYACQSWELNYRIVKIISTTSLIENRQCVTKQKGEFYWTEDMVTKTFWYIAIMIAGVFFHARIGIWIFATIIWYVSTFKKK
jgi:hypothetical protein